MKKRFSKFSQVFTTTDDRVSSRRVWGALGWVVVIGINIYCTIKHTEAPEITEIVCIVSASLLGIGVIEPYFKSKKGPKIVSHEHYPEDSQEEPEELG